MEALNAAIAVALPIDQRSYPRCRTLPMTRRPRTATNAVREQEQLLARHLFPELLGNDGRRQRRRSAVAVSRDHGRRRSHLPSLTAAGTSAETEAEAAAAALPEAPSCPVARRLVAKLSSVRRGRSGSDEVEKHNKPGKCDSQRQRGWPLRVDSLENGQPQRAALPSTSPTSRSHHHHEFPKYGESDGAPLNRSTIDDDDDHHHHHHHDDDQHRQEMGDEKWHPDRSESWTQAQATEYSRRCLLVMYEYSPRRHDVIVKDGNWWRIDWETETLRGCRPVLPR